MLSPHTPAHPAGRMMPDNKHRSPWGRWGLPHAVQVGEVEGGQQLTEGSVTDPAEERKGPPEAGEEAQLKYTHVVAPAQGSRKQVAIRLGCHPARWPLSSGSSHPPRLGTGGPAQHTVTPQACGCRHHAYTDGPQCVSPRPLPDSLTYLTALMCQPTCAMDLN